jgi:hypothetical protein
MISYSLFANKKKKEREEKKLLPGSETEGFSANGKWRGQVAKMEKL